VAGFFICAMSTRFIHRGRTSYAPLAHMGSNPILATGKSRTYVKSWVLFSFCV